MKKDPPKYAQSTLLLRLLAGAYLLYTAWGLQDAVNEGPLFIVAMVAFGIIGTALIAHAGWKMYKGEYEGGSAYAQPADEEAQPEETEN